jgi:lysophospholipase L1-like esterase
MKIKLSQSIKIFPIVICVLLSLSHPAWSQDSSGQDWAGLRHYRKANAKLNPPSQGQMRVVFMGNSITELWGDLDPGFFKKNSYINRGISGQTTPQMLIRFRPDVIHLHPSVVVILGGTNDIAGNTGPSSLEMIEDNLASMAQLAKINHIKVVLCSLTPASKYPWNPKIQHVAAKITKLNKWIKHFAHQHGFIYCNYYPTLVNGKGGMKSDYTKDGVHPNKKGYKLMEPIVVHAIRKALNQTQ